VRLKNKPLGSFKVNVLNWTMTWIFSERQHAECAICYRPSVCLSVCLSHRWISRNRLKLGPCNFHRTVASSLYFLQGKFHPEILTGAVIVRHGVCTYFSTYSAQLTWSVKLLHYFAINDIHAEIYSAVVYFSDSCFKLDFCGYMDTDIKLGKFHIHIPH